MLEIIAGLCANKKVVAVGETGLDYFENPIPKEVQKKAFALHIRLAVEKKLPLILHGRNADTDMLEVLAKEGRGLVKGVFHCFSGDAAYARQVLDAGFMVSFTGVITFKNAHAVRETVKSVPLERMMIETDCPYLAPQAFRGKRNEPSYVVHVAEKIAELKQLSFDEVAEKTSANAVKFFSLGER
jgi:TatD DNase family protein